MAKKKQAADVEVADAVEVTDAVETVEETVEEVAEKPAKAAKASKSEPELSLADEKAALAELAPRIAPAFDSLRVAANALSGENIAANAERLAESGSNAESVQGFKFAAAQVLLAIDEANAALAKVADAISKVS